MKTNTFKTNIKSFIVLVLFLCFGISALNAQTTTSPCATNSCTAKDFNLTNFYLGDASGDPFVNGSCTPGSPVDAHIFVSFTTTAAASRYSLFLSFDVKITKPDGTVQSFTETACLYDKTAIPVGGALDIYTFMWNCGDQVELSNFYMSWQSSQTKSCGESSSKCYCEPGPVIIDAPLVANYTYTTNCNTNYAIDFSTFVTGGKIKNSNGTSITNPYKYTWNWGDSTSTGPTALMSGVSNFSHTFPGPGTYNVTLTASDTATPTPSTDTQTYSVTVYNPLSVSGIVSNATCNNQDGTINITASSGSGSYSYTWTKDGNSYSMVEDLSSLDAGTYEVTVKDVVTKCTVKKSFVINSGDNQAPIISGAISPTTIDGCDVSDAPAAQTTVAGLEALLGNLTISDNISADANISVNSSDSVSGSCPIVITRTYTVKDECLNESAQFTHTTTINIPAFSAITPTSQTVDCENNIIVATPPSINDACGNNITPSGPVVSTSPVCEGDITYTWTYTDCAGHSQDYVDTVTIEREPFAVIAGTTDTVACYADIVLPTPPAVTDNCNNAL
ncbi:HYR-like domain-containing protein, partial [Flavobacteriaceae bacterium LMO-SS05]